jgi:hypothetical protein
MRISAERQPCVSKDRRILYEAVITWKISGDFVTANSVEMQNMHGGLSVHLGADDLIC